MSALGFTDQRARLRRVLENSIEGAVYDTSETEEGGSAVVLRAHRRDGRRVAVRFRGVSDSEASETPQPGSPLTVRDVGSPSRWAFLRRVVPVFRVGFEDTRVRIDAGGARLDIVCQDAEWWEDAGTA